MPPALRICFCASELAPLSKTGGLADVAASLPRRLHTWGHDVRVFTPFHRQIDRRAHRLYPVDFLQDVPLSVGWRRSSFSVWATTLPGSDLAIYLVDCPEMFDRPAIYTGEADEARRFALFSRAVLACCQRMGFAPQILHCNDWHTALLPLLLRTEYAWDALFHSTRTLLTLHNVGYQGVFPAQQIDEIGLAPWAHLFDQQDLRANRLNFLRTGIIYADLITTVSPTYAREIRQPGLGMGIDDLLRARAGRLVGVLNGVDYEEWSPEKDRFIPHRYSRRRMAGKRKNKHHLLETLHLANGTRPALLGIVSRLVQQKGFDLCFPVLPDLLATRDLRLTVLGSGEARYEEFFTWLQRRFPQKVVYHRGYHEELAHLIEAASDLFLMPSRYEPCGLNQMFSLRYGTIPVVRRTGGLADSVRPFEGPDGRGTGFVFEHFTPEGLHWALDLALRIFQDGPTWRALMSNAMAEDFSWERQAGRYVDLYEWLSSKGQGE